MYGDDLNGANVSIVNVNRSSEIWKLSSNWSYSFCLIFVSIFIHPSFDSTFLREQLVVFCLSLCLLFDDDFAVFFVALVVVLLTLFDDGKLNKQISSR